MTEPNAFLDNVDDARVTAAIRAAEQRTSCEFRVFIAREAVDYPVLAASEQFERMQMHRTRLRNAVLIFIAPRSQNFALYADRAAHSHLGHELMRQLSAEMSMRFRTGRFTEGIVHVLETLGISLAQVFPTQGDERNELSDEIERG